MSVTGVTRVSSGIQDENCSRGTPDNLSAICVGKVILLGEEDYFTAHFHLVLVPSPSRTFSLLTTMIILMLSPIPLSLLLNFTPVESNLCPPQSPPFLIPFYPFLPSLKSYQPAPSSGSPPTSISTAHSCEVP